MRRLVGRLSSSTLMFALAFAAVATSTADAQPLSQMPQAGRTATGAPAKPVDEPMVPEPLKAPAYDPPMPAEGMTVRNTDRAELARRCQAGNAEACNAIAENPDANTSPLPPR